MKLQLSLYRNLLRRLERVRAKYNHNADNVVFILFGIALYRCDFAAAGYGNSLRAIAHTCFARPSVQDCAMDTPNARLAAAFTAIRTLTEAEEKKAWLPGLQMQLPRRDAAAGDEGDGRARRAQTTTPRPHGTSSSAGNGADDKQGAGRTDKANNTTDTTIKGSGKEVHKTADDGGTGVVEEEEEEMSEKDIEVQEEDGVLYGIATIILEAKHKRQFKLQNKLIINQIKNKMPPYRYLIPPEPLYAQDNLQVAPFPFMVDALLCLTGAAAASYAPTATTAATAAAATPSSSSSSSLYHTAEAAAASITCPQPLPPLVHQLPCTAPELLSQLSRIPTRTVTQTSFVEVEVFATPIYTAVSPPSDTTAAQQASSAPHDTSASKSGNDTSSSSATAAAPCPAAAAMIANVRSTAERAARGKKDLHLYSFYICLRNRAAPDTWHFHVMSNHFILLTPATETTTELTNAGLGGTMGMLEPGKSCVYILGVIANAAEGVLRGTIQINAFDMNGTRRSMDVAVGPTRFSATRPQAPPADFTSDKHTAFIGRVAGTDEHK